jgi:hypothetical protein
VTGPEQHAAAVERLAKPLRTHIDTEGLVVPPDDAMAALDELVALAELGEAKANLIEAAAAAEARADELQRELGYTNGLRQSMFEQLEQARREADELRATLRSIDVGYALTAEEMRDRARAALAGVQADKECKCPAGSYDRGNAVHAPYCPLAEEQTWPRRR